MPAIPEEYHICGLPDKWWQSVFRIRIRFLSWCNQVSGSGSRRAKITHKNIKVTNFHVWSAGCSLLKAEGFSCSLNVLYGGLGISKLQFVCLFVVNLFKFLVVKTLDQDADRFQPKMLDPDPESMIPLRNAGSNVLNSYRTRSKQSKAPA
jgi:hypothetical protein